MSEIEDIKSSLKAIKDDISELKDVLAGMKARDAWAVIVSHEANLQELEGLVALKDQKKLVVSDLGDGTKFVSCT